MTKFNPQERTQKEFMEKPLPEPMWPGGWHGRPAEPLLNRAPNELIWVKGTTPVKRGIHSKQCPNCMKMRTEDELRPGGVHICYGAGIQPGAGDA